MKYKYLLLSVLSLSAVSNGKEEGLKKAGDGKVLAANVVMDEITKIINEGDKLNTEFSQGMDPNFTEDEVRASEQFKVVIEDRKKRSSKILELAKLAPESAISEKGLTWAYHNLSSDGKIEAFGILQEHHKENKLLVFIVEGMKIARTPDVKAIRGLLADSKNEEVRLVSAVTLSSVLRRDPANHAEALALDKKIVAWPNIDKFKSSYLPSTFLADAKRRVYEVDNFSIGSEAPDIVGTDHEDKEFKLSDY